MYYHISLEVMFIEQPPNLSKRQAVSTVSSILLYDASLPVIAVTVLCSVRSSELKDIATEAVYLERSQHHQ